MTLSTYQFYFNGLTFGAGTNYVVTSIDGLTGFPDLRVQDDNRGYMDGMFTGRDFLGARHFTLEILTIAGGGYTAQQNFETLRAALMYSQSRDNLHLMRFAIPPFTQQEIWCRVRDHRTSVDPEFTYGYIRSQFTFYAPDALIYDTTSKETTIIGNSSGVVTNDGTVETPLNFRIFGPMSSGYTITDGTNAMTLHATLPDATYSINIDTQTRAIVMSIPTGSFSARNILTTGSTWITGAGKGNTTFTVTASGGSTRTYIDYQNAYL